MPMTKKKRQLKRAKMKYFKNDKKKNKDEISNNDTKLINDIESEAGSPLTPEKVDNFATELKSTPMRKKRIHKSTPNESMNVTNLNILFDSEFIYNAHPGNDIFISKTNSARKRSLSSISKFSSPVKGSPYRKHKHTQTPDKKDIVLPICIANEETPKCRKIFTMQKNTTEKSHRVIKNKLLGKKFKNDINFNPYLKHMEPNYRDDTVFTTPITNHRDLVENLTDAIFSPKTPTFRANVNINKTPKEKILKKEITIQSLKSSSFNISTGSRTVKKTPKSPGKTHSTKANGYFSKYDNNKKSSMEVSFNKTDTGCCDNLFSRLRKYCKLTQNWTGKIVNVCFHLGLQLKNTISSIYVGDSNCLQGSIRLSCNKCEEYRAEVTKLSIKVDDIENVNKKLNDEMQKLRDEFGQFAHVISEIESLKNELKTIKNNPSVPMIPPPPPPPPMPPMAPPPPPPPPPPPLMTINSNKLMISKKKNGGEDKENSRPVISLEDILKVKLKKPKPYQATPTTHRTSQPPVSLDMLRQVKLRPSSSKSSSKSVSIPDSQSLDVTLSPNTNLCRLLKTDIMTSGESSAKGETDSMNFELDKVQD